MTEMELQSFLLEVEFDGSKVEECIGESRCWWCGNLSDHEPFAECYEGTVEDYYYDRHYY